MAECYEGGDGDYGRGGLWVEEEVKTGRLTNL